MSRADLNKVLRLYKSTVRKDMLTIAFERRAHHKSAIKELKNQNKHLKKKLINQYKQSVVNNNGPKSSAD